MVKKIIYTLLGLSLTQVVWANLSLTSDSYNPFIGELLEVIAIVPNVDLNSPYELNITGVSYDLIKEKKYQYTINNAETGEQLFNIKYVFNLILNDPGKATINFLVDDYHSNDIVVNVKSITVTDIPFLINSISSVKLYVGEKGFVVSHIVSDKYINESYIRPELDFDVSPLVIKSQKSIYINGKPMSLKVTNNYSFTSNKAGTFLIPESKILLDNQKLIAPSYKIEVVNPKIKLSKDVVMGKSIDIKVLDLEKEYLKGDKVNFTIELTGEANFDNLDSLKSYFNIPSFLLEERGVKVDKYNDGKMSNFIKFNYSGYADSYTGFNIKFNGLPMFNTEKGELENIEFQDLYLPGNFSLYYIIIVIITILFVIIILFFTNKYKRPLKVKSTEIDKIDIETPIKSKFNLSNRENEILTILANGKSNKDIADELSISVETVKKHVHNILKKTNTNSRLELIYLVIDKKL